VAHEPNSPRLLTASEALAEVRDGDFSLNIRVHCAKLNIFSCADCRIIGSHEGQEAYSQTDTSCPLPDVWREAGREMRTQHGTPPDTTAS
jgi:hypothetical protein